MRTTLSLDPDVAILLEKVRKAKRLSLKQAVNEALRAGLTQLATPPWSMPDRESGRHLGSLAIENGFVLYSTDRDFARFPELQWQDPLEAR
jgi:hypothetical protein